MQSAQGIVNDLDHLVSVARAHLYWLFGKSTPVKRDFMSVAPLPRVNVTLRVRGAVRGSMSGNGETFSAQLFDAVYRASRDNRFSGSLVKADLDHVSVEVWLQTSAELIPAHEREREDVLLLGVDGVEVSQGKSFAYYKPSVALTSHHTTPQSLFSALCKKANLPADAWKDPECSLRKTSWIHLCETPGGTVAQLTALRTKVPFEVTTESMVRWIQNSVSYFNNNQYSDGVFCYHYRPFLDAVRKSEANPVRASGCAYAIAAAASLSQFENDAETIACAERALNAILRRSVRFERGGSYIADGQSEPSSGKLGSTALLLLALLTPHFRATYGSQIADLLAGIRSAQQESGLFDCTFGVRDSSESQINFFPGQALLALVMRTEQGDQSCRSYYQRAFIPYRDYFRAAPSTAFVGWQADVWSRAALLDSNADYAEFVFEQIDWLLQFQIHKDKDNLVSGGFSWNGKPPNYSSIVYTEAIARGADLAYCLGDRRWLRYREAFQDGIQFCSRLRLTREQSAFFPHPNRAVGGMTESISNFDVRSDVVQHTITLALAVLERPILLYHV